MMQTEELKQLLVGGNHSLVVDNGDIYTYDGRGVADLYRLLAGHPSLLKGARVADKVVGKGAAALMVVGGVAEVHAQLISTPARELLAANGVGLTFDSEVSHILNRAGDGLCPVERLCLDCATAEDCLPKITDFLKTITHK